jgi:hypothetical protein
MVVTLEDVDEDAAVAVPVLVPLGSCEDEGEGVTLELWASPFDAVYLSSEGISKCTALGPSGEHT